MKDINTLTKIFSICAGKVYTATSYDVVTVVTQIIRGQCYADGDGRQFTMLDETV